MLIRTLVTPELLEVEEITMSFTSTHSRYWYYDLTNWLRSMHGKQGETPTQPMHHKDIEWVRNYHLPKVIKKEVKPRAPGAGRPRLYPVNQQQG